MKKIIITALLLAGTLNLYASDLSDSFSDKYQSLVPPENSSVHSDYLFQQIALGSEYTIRILDQINQTNEDSNGKVDLLIERFDILIEQNKTIIELLKKTKAK